MSTLLIDDLRNDRDQALEFFAAEPTVLARTYAPGKWSARQILLHLTDANGVLLDRLRRLQADDKPLLWAFNQNHWAEHLKYDKRDLRLATDLFAATINTIAELAALTPGGNCGRWGEICLS
jgi:hypothetical protein